MIYVCPTCDTWWKRDPDRGPGMRVYVCPDCKRAQDDYDDARDDARRDET